MPLYYSDESLTPLFKQVTKACDELQETSDVETTLNTRVLIFNTLSAVLEDPSPYWREGEEDRQGRFADLTEQLPALLSKLAKVEGLKAPARRITYFQTLHWLQRNLDKFCPFEKLIEPRMP
jgi:hypothetical protein